MGKFEAWVGECLIEAEENGQKQNLECFVAVWAQGRKDFEDTLRQHFTDQPLDLLWAEEILPVTGWLQKHGHNNTVMDLAPAVNSRHKVELGAFTQVASAATANASSYLTITEHDIPPLSDQSSVPQQYQEWIAPELKELLFGQSETDTNTNLRTYFIVDPTLRKKVTGEFDLESTQVDVPIQCLFKGKKAIELKEAAPYLIDMTLPNGAWANTDTVPNFHKDFFQHHWGQNTGIFVRTKASFETVWQHYRHFTLVKREGHKAKVFVAFWTEQYVRLYFPHISDNQDRVAMWFIRDELMIHSMMADKTGGMALNKATLNATLFDEYSESKTPFVVTEYDLEPFYKDREIKDLEMLANTLKEDFSNELVDRSLEDILSTIAEPLERMRGYGFSKKGHLYLLALWIVFIGQDFETEQDPTGERLKICQSNIEARKKIDALKMNISQHAM